jgi:hypothetical protein
LRITKNTPEAEIEAELAYRKARKREASKAYYAENFERLREEARNRYSKQKTAREMNGISRIFQHHFEPSDKKLFDRMVALSPKISGLHKANAIYIYESFKNSMPMKGWQDDARAAIESAS